MCKCVQQNWNPSVCVLICMVLPFLFWRFNKRAMPAILAKVAISLFINIGSVALPRAHGLYASSNYAHRSRNEKPWTLDIWILYTPPSHITSSPRISHSVLEYQQNQCESGAAANVATKATITTTTSTTREEQPVNNDNTGLTTANDKQQQHQCVL